MNDITIIGAGITAIYITYRLKLLLPQKNILLLLTGGNIDLLFCGGIEEIGCSKEEINILNSLLDDPLLKVVIFDEKKYLFNEIGKYREYEGSISICNQDNIDNGVSIFYPLNFKSWMIDLAIKGMKHRGIEVEVLPVSGLNPIRSFVSNRMYLLSQDLSASVKDALIEELLSHGKKARFDTILIPPYFNMDFFKVISKILQEKDKILRTLLSLTSPIFGISIMKMLIEKLNETNIEMYSATVNKIVFESTINIYTSDNVKFDTKKVIFIPNPLDYQKTDLMVDNKKIEYNSTINSVDRLYRPLNHSKEILHPGFFVYNPENNIDFFNNLGRLEDFLNSFLNSQLS